MDLDHVGSTVYVLLLEQIMPKAAEDTPNPIKVRIPASNHPDGVLRLEIHNNDRLFIVGPNGSGKSALIQHFVSAIQNRKTRRISAHRQTWLASSAIGMTAQRRYDAETRITARERHKDARWKDELAAERLSAVLFDLVAAENERARNIAHLLDIDNLKEAKITAVDFPSPFRRINTLLVAGNLSVQIAATTGEQIFAHYLKGDPFSMAKLSDGERNAIILAATVLTVESGTVLLIDEPERHLHRSIIEPFLTALFASRTDCPFIISTHDLSLPIAAPDARVLLPRSCEWEGDVVKSFDIDLLEGRTDLPEYLKISI